MMDRLKDEKLRISEQHRFLNLLIDASPMGVVIEEQQNGLKCVHCCACLLLMVKNLKILFYIIYAHFCCRNALFPCFVDYLIIDICEILYKINLIT